jgi:hypothetical protein
MQPAQQNSALSTSAARTARENHTSERKTEDQKNMSVAKQPAGEGQTASVVSFHVGIGKFQDLRPAICREPFPWGRYFRFNFKKGSAMKFNPAIEKHCQSNTTHLSTTPIRTNGNQ